MKNYLEAVQQHGYTLRYAPENIRTPELCLAAVQQNGYVLEFVPKNIRTQENGFITGEKWTVCFDKTHLRVGCQRHSFADWAEFTDEQINKMDTGALRWWRTNRERMLSLQGV